MQIIPISELRNANKVSELCHSIGEPVCITKNGYGDMALMDMRTFEKLTRQTESMAKPGKPQECSPGVSFVE